MNNNSSKTVLKAPYRRIIPLSFRERYWKLRAWAIALATRPKARWDFAANVLTKFGKSIYKANTPHGPLWVDLRDIGVGRSIFINGYYEKSESMYIRNSLSSGMSYLDIGGNIGYFATLAGELVGASGQIVVIEPENHNFTLLQRNLKMHNITNAKIYNVAAGQRPCVAKLYKASENLGDHRLYSEQITADRDYVEVPVVKIDDLYRDEVLRVPDFIKIDVQGYEPFVIAGLEDTILKSRHISVLTEYWPIGIKAAGGDPAAYLTWFDDRDFKCHLLGENGELIPIEIGNVDARLPELMPEWPGAQLLNLVFVRLQ